MSASKHASLHERWAHLRFSVVGQLLAAPPPKGELRAEIAELAARTWHHPTTGEPVRFGFSTIERWLYRAREHATRWASCAARYARTPASQHAGRACARPCSRSTTPTRAGATAPSRQPRRTGRARRAPRPRAVVPDGAPLHEGARAAQAAPPRPARPPASSAPSSGWRPARCAATRPRTCTASGTADFHGCSRRCSLRRASGRRRSAVGVLDDRSRLCCHPQWYLDENAENFVHGSSQAFQKRGLPREYLSDNGGAMTAAETREGLARLLVHHTTLACSP